ncbi:MAG: DUF2946 family protein [Betaproteobacteria bacterium]|jgi:hypothetical protein
MDPIVIQAMAKWPAVPNVFGWLSLDRRGHWLIKGDRIANTGVTGFIGRNYAEDERGRWFFQNGPQRVFVQLEYTPFVVYTAGGASMSLETHTGEPIARISGAWMDDTGSLLLRWASAIGVVNDRDLATIAGLFTDLHARPVSDSLLARAFDAGSRRQATGVYVTYAGNRVPVGRIKVGEVAQKFGFDPAPKAKEGQPDC